MKRCWVGVMDASPRVPRSSILAGSPVGRRSQVTSGQSFKQAAAEQKSDRVINKEFGTGIFEN
jgi:hypothetical protein